jgi:hypothetical protein
MPTYYSYVARLDSPGFFWNDIPDDRYRFGNTPRPIILPTEDGGLGLAPEFIDDWSKKAGLHAQQIDWGAWGMALRKSDLKTIWNSYKEYAPWKKGYWLSVWNQIELLPDDQDYILVVMEMP